MAFSKSNLYDPDDQMTSFFFKALAYPGRMEILRKLHYEGPLCVYNLGLTQHISKESLSDHLRILRNASLIVCEERFPYTFYDLDEKTMEKAIKLIIEYLKIFQNKE